MAVKFTSLVVLLVFTAVMLKMSQATPYPPPPPSTTTEATTTTTTTQPPTKYVRPAPPRPTKPHWTYKKPSPAALPAPPSVKLAPPAKPSPAVKPTHPVIQVRPVTNYQCNKNQLEGTLVPAKDCHKFYICNHGKLVEFSCNKGLHFNRKHKVCDYPHKAGCVPPPHSKALKCYYA